MRTDGESFTGNLKNKIMAAPCCPLCYKQYFETNGSLDEEAFIQFAEALIEKRQDIPDEITPCYCPCHIKGAQILH